MIISNVCPLRLSCSSFILTNTDIPQGLYFLLRIILPGGSFPPTFRQLTLYILTAIPVLVLYRHLSSVGLPRRDPATGALIAPGEDLAQSGVTEWCWDVIYVTWACQVGSSLFGEWVWWGYLSVRKFSLFLVLYRLVRGDR